MIGGDEKMKKVDLVAILVDFENISLALVNQFNLSSERIRQIVSFRLAKAETFQREPRAGTWLGRESIW